MTASLQHLPRRHVLTSDCSRLPAYDSQQEDPNNKARRSSPCQVQPLGHGFQRALERTVPYDDEDRTRQQLCEDLSDSNEQPGTLLGRKASSKADHLLFGKRGRAEGGGDETRRHKKKEIGSVQRATKGALQNSTSGHGYQRYRIFDAGTSCSGSKTQQIFEEQNT